MGVPLMSYTGIMNTLGAVGPPSNLSFGAKSIAGGQKSFEEFLAEMGLSKDSLPPEALGQLYDQYIKLNPPAQVSGPRPAFTGGF